MAEWKTDEARRRLGEIIGQAERCGPQRIGGPDGSAVVLSERDFRRILAEAGLREADLEGEEIAPGGGSLSFVEFMQRSPLAEAFRTGEISGEEWDRACRSGR
jgi:hypothetical protein